MCFWKPWVWICCGQWRRPRNGASIQTGSFWIAPPSPACWGTWAHFLAWGLAFTCQGTAKQQAGNTAASLSGQDVLVCHWCCCSFWTRWRFPQITSYFSTLCHSARALWLWWFPLHSFLESYVGFHQKTSMKSACSSIFVQNANRCSFVLQLLIFKLNAVLHQTFLQCTLYKIPQMACAKLKSFKQLWTFSLLDTLIFCNSLHYENHMSI